MSAGYAVMVTLKSHGFVIPIVRKHSSIKTMACYKPYKISEHSPLSDWVGKLELDAARDFAMNVPPIKTLVLYGSLRKVSYSRLLAFEFARILDRLNADVRIFNSEGLPMKDDTSDDHHKVQELRELNKWSEAQVWVSPEMHGNITGVLKNQIDWIPLSLGSVRPTQGKTLAVAEVSGGSQSFNAVNNLRILGRWMRMFVIQNQSSVPKAWTEFDSNGRMKPSSMRDRIVDVAEELIKFTIIMRPHTTLIVDRYSERNEKREKGRLLSQYEKEINQKI